MSGSVGGNDSELTVLTVRKIGGSQKDSMHFEEELGTGEDPCRWTIKFQDKTIVIENGKLVEERRRGVGERQIYIFCMSCLLTDFAERCKINQEKCTEGQDFEDEQIRNRHVQRVHHG